MKRARSVAIVLVALLAVAVLFFAYPWVYAWGAGKYWDAAAPEVHLIPNGYIGPVVIILSDQAAPPPQMEGKARLFRIPESGIARSRFAVNEGWSRPDYFYVDLHGRRTRIVSGTPCDLDLPGDPVQACRMGHLTYGNPYSDKPYEAYIVGRKADQSFWAHRAEAFADSVVYGRR
jgi:hypothetical protein